MKFILLSDSLEYPEEREPVREWLKLKSECLEEEDGEDMIQEWNYFLKVLKSNWKWRAQISFLDMR